jgi:excisionase family DNA binding protein
MAKEKQYLTVIQTARQMNVTRGAIYKKIRNGQIVARNICGRFLIPVEEADMSRLNVLTEKGKAEIDRGVEKVVKEYGETLKLLGKE